MVDLSREVLTIKEVAVELDRSVQQVRRYVRDGKLSAKKIGVQWFVAPRRAVQPQWSQARGRD